MKHALSAAVALALGIGLVTTAQANAASERQSAVPGTDMQAGASAPTRHATTRHQQSRQQVMHTQRMLQARGLYNGRIDGLMGRQTQMALTRSQHHQTGSHRVAALHKAPPPAKTGPAIGVGSSTPNKRDAMSGSSTIPPTPATPPSTQTPNAGGNNDQKTSR